MHSQAEVGAGGEGAIRVFTGEHLEPPYLVYDRFHYQLSNRGGGGFLATGRTVGGKDDKELDLSCDPRWHEVADRRISGTSCICLVPLTPNQPGADAYLF